MTLIEKAAIEFNINPDELIKLSLESFLEQKSLKINSEIFLIAKKYGVKDIFEMDNKVSKGELSENLAYEDYFKLDNLQEEQEKIKKIPQRDLTKDIEIIKRIAETEFSIIVKQSFIIDYKLRIILADESFIDINVSNKLKGKFGFHWETKNSSNDIFRYDNFPDSQWSFLQSFPFHFHFQTQENVIEPPFPRELISAFREFMNFVKNQLQNTK